MNRLIFLSILLAGCTSVPAAKNELSLEETKARCEQIKQYQEVSDILFILDTAGSRNSSLESLGKSLDAGTRAFKRNLRINKEKAGLKCDKF